MKERITMSDTGSTVATRKRAADKPKTVARGGGGNGAENLSYEDARVVLAALSGLKQGDSSIRLPLEWTGLQGKISEAFNDVVELNARMAEELARLRQKVGKEGKLKLRAEMSDARGFWRDELVC